MMRVIEIRNTRQGEVAYIFDEEGGRLIKVLVEDFTGYNEVREEEPIVRRAPVARRPARVVEQVEEVDFDVDRELPPPPPRPRQAPKSIIPPHLAGVFKPAGSPGAAEEVRHV